MKVGAKFWKVSRRGQGLTEFALILPILLLVILGIVAFGHFTLVYILTVTSAREAARYGSTVGVGTAGVRRFQDCDGIFATARKSGQIAGVGNNNIAVHYDSGPSSGSLGTCTVGNLGPNVELGDRIVVDVDIVYRTIVPLLPIPPIPISATSSRTIIRDVYVGTAPPLPTLPPGVTPTPSFTPTNTATETPTPTDDSTPTPGPSETPQPTNTPWPTSTYTATPTETPTPTATNTPRPTATPIICPVWENGANGIPLQFGYSSIGATLRNPQPTSLWLTRVDLRWPNPSAAAKMQNVRYGASTLWEGIPGQFPPSFSLCELGCDITWTNPLPAARLTSGNNVSKDIAFGFSRSIQEGTYIIDLWFDNGCHLSTSADYTR